jgi:hypothetical protein
MSSTGGHGKSWRQGGLRSDLLTTVPQGWIAERLGMRSAANVSQQTRRFASKEPRVHSREIRRWLCRRPTLPDSVAGIPIVVTDSIVNTEA